MIKVDGLCKSFGKTVAVDHLSFEVNEGEILGMIGPNGAGKTTTMRAMVGVLPFKDGDVRIGPHSLKEEPVAAKLLMAFVPAEPRLFDYLTVYEHLQFFGRLYARSHFVSNEDLARKCDQLIEDLDLQPKRNHLPGALSRGMAQKLMIGTALVHEPRILLMDEPFTGLDPIAIRNMRALLKNMAARGSAILISSHLLSMVEDMIDRVLILQQGKKRAEGSLEDLKESYQISAGEADLEDIFLQAIESGKETEVLNHD